MHFWIDKRSQCAYTGRHRVPTSLSSGRPRSRSLGRKAMAAPVHRFTAVATVEVPPRRPHRSTQNHYPRTTNSIPSVHTTTRRQAEESSLYVEMPPQPTIASLAAARSVTPDTLLRTAALGLQHSPMMAPHLKFGVLVSFALATVFLAGAKFYFDRQVARGGMSSSEVGVVCVLAGLAGVGCVWCACRRDNSRPFAVPDRVSSTARRELNGRSTDTSEQASVTSPVAVATSTAESSPEAPPPYHIAVLLPREAPSPPPPAYSALS